MERPLTLEKAPLLYAPENELGVVYLFSHVARKLQFRIEKIRAKYPDCIAYRRSGNSEKRVRIEFEFKSSNFRSHRHDPSECDCIVCWDHDWPDVPDKIEVIELKRFFGVGFNIWIQPALKSQWHHLDQQTKTKWATTGDLLLMYRCAPEKSISDIFLHKGQLKRGEAEWRSGKAYFGHIERLCKLDAPIFLEDMRNHRVLKTSSFIRRNMQGNHLVSEYWFHLYEMIINRNPSVKRLLVQYDPENL